MANISAIKLPNGVTYDIVDRVSKDVFIAEYGVTMRSLMGKQSSSSGNLRDITDTFLVA